MKALIVLLATGAVMLAQTPPPAKSAAPATKSAAPATKSTATPAKSAPAPAPTALLHPETLKAIAPATFEVKFTTTKGEFTATVHRDWSPNGADRFYNLAKNRYFTDCSFFRIVPGFIAQFGMAPDPKVGAVWQNANIKDDPAKPNVHNTKGTLVFATAGPGTRTTQLFINLNDNTRSLDPQGFTPFAEITDGMDVVMNLYSGYGDGSDMGGHGPTQGMIVSQGKPYLDKNFPKLDSIKTAIVVPPAGTAAPATKSTAAPKPAAPATKSTAAPAAVKK